MEEILQTNESPDSWQATMFFYQSALKQIETKIDLINAEFEYRNNYSPIEHIKSRIKTPESAIRKLQKFGYEIELANMVKYIDDIAGIRIICSFSDDIYKIYRMLLRQFDIKIVQVKDYIAEPKPNGYKSLHVIVKVPIYLASGTIDTKVEIQLRTIAMDFWASLEHKIHYKFAGEAPDNIVEDLKECADMISNLDDRMLLLNKKVHEVNRKREVEIDNFQNICEGL